MSEWIQPCFGFFQIGSVRVSRRMKIRFLVTFFASRISVVV